MPARSGGRGARSCRRRRSGMRSSSARHAGPGGRPSAARRRRRHPPAAAPREAKCTRDLRVRPVCNTQRTAEIQRPSISQATARHRCGPASPGHTAILTREAGSRRDRGLMLKGPPSSRPWASARYSRCTCAQRCGAPARSPPPGSCRPPSDRWCPCRAGARCRHRGSRAAPTWWASRLSIKVPTSCLRPGAMTRPAGLFTTSRCSSSKTMGRSDGLGAKGLAFRRRDQRHRHLLPDAQLARGH